MRFGLLAAFAALGALATSASAADWWWVGTAGAAGAGSNVYVDKASLEQRGKEKVRVWVLAHNENERSGFATRTFSEFDCARRTGAVISGYTYNSAGAVINATTGTPTGEPEARSIKPNTYGDMILRVVCGKVPGLQVPAPVAHSQLQFHQAPQRAETEETADEEAPSAETKPQMSIGTGFFVGPKGDVLTSYHVVEGAQRIGCRTADGEFHNASVSRLSRANDLAVVRVKVRPKSYLSFAPRGSLRPGDRVFTVGYGAANFLGVSEPRFTDGTVSALSGFDAEDAYMQISVPVHPGNSGGPLVNEAGQVVGVIAAQAAVGAFLKAVGTLPQNVNLAVKSDYASPLLSGVGASPKRSRQDAIKVTQESLCLIVAEG